MSFEREKHVPMIQALLKHNAYFGTSTWTCPEWRGKVYLGDYRGARKDFVEKVFKEKALEEYSQVFTSGCLDASYYDWPGQKQFERYNEQIADGFKLGMKVTNTITHRRMNGNQFGPLNPNYLNWGMFEEKFLKPVTDILGSKLGPIIIEFSPFHFSKRTGSPSEYQPLDFVKDLHKFLSNIPKGYYFSVEVRDPELVLPPFTRYFDCLNYHGVAHVINQHKLMPAIEDHVEIPGSTPAEYIVVRTLERPGLGQAEAKEMFAPFIKAQRPVPEMRHAIAKLVANAIEDQKTIFVYANNQTEGNSPDTIAGVLEDPALAHFFK